MQPGDVVILQQWLHIGRPDALKPLTQGVVIAPPRKDSCGREVLRVDFGGQIEVVFLHEIQRAE